ncbi:phosphotransferase family protein [Elsinoe ampelina]|uniref:Phosphotransferase family protein n=1 Tax=Elsinoe ampelina TaxID=302913 RepID=A0A6A6GRU2_9PEZI|nr:phosphotransferase family protein [Elsinoe ampelina]
MRVRAALCSSHQRLLSCGILARSWLPPDTRRRLFSDGPENLFGYTSGRWIFNEHIRLKERRIEFDVEALKIAITTSVDRPLSELKSLSKLAEGGFNRVFEARFADGLKVLARLPYSLTVPKHYSTASEVATLGFLRSLSFPVPRVFGYCATDKNPVGSEYILEEKIEGTHLGGVWYIIDNKARKKINRQIVDLEERLLRTRLPASGSLYYARDLSEGDRRIPVSNSAGENSTSDQLVVGPIAGYGWHYRLRGNLKAHLGPWSTFADCFKAPALREIAWCNKYGSPRQHVERHLRHIYDFDDMKPDAYIQVLEEYLRLAPSLDLPADHAFSRPVLRHPDLSPSNIIVSDDFDVVGVIDWQHSAVLPLCLAAGIPKHMQNWGDPASGRLEKPATKLPDNYDEMSSHEKSEVTEKLRRRLVHFLYAAKTMVQVPEHFEAFRQPAATLRARLYTHAAWPWEGNNLTLKKDLIDTVKAWPLVIKSGTAQQQGVYEVQTFPTCPLKYSDQEIAACEDLVEKEEESTAEYLEMQEALDIDQQGWVDDDEHYEKSRELARSIKESLLEEAETEAERISALHHFPFEDHEEL